MLFFFTFGKTLFEVFYHFVAVGFGCGCFPDGLKGLTRGDELLVFCAGEQTSQLRCNAIL